MQTKGIDDLITQLRASAAFAAGQTPAAATREASKTSVSFGAALKGAIEQVNDVQQKAASLARDFETGKSGVGLHEVMISLQKANVAFQGVVQVRNRLVNAYQDIMNMQV